MDISPCCGYILDAAIFNPPGVSSEKRKPLLTTGSIFMSRVEGKPISDLKWLCLDE